MTLQQSSNYIDHRKKLAIDDSYRDRNNSVSPGDIKLKPLASSSRGGPYCQSVTNRVADDRNDSKSIMNSLNNRGSV